MKQSYLHYAFWFSKRAFVGVVLHAILLWSVAFALRPPAMYHGIFGLVAYSFAFLIPAYLSGMYAVSRELRALKNGESWRLAVFFALAAAVIAALVTLVNNVIVLRFIGLEGYSAPLPDMVTFVIVWSVCAIIFLVPIRLVFGWAGRRGMNVLDIEISDTFS